MLLADKKDSIRRDMLQQRRQLTAEERDSESQAICAHLRALMPAVGSNKVLHTFLPTSLEVNLWPLIRRWLDSGYSLTVPHTLAKPVMQQVLLHDLTQLKKGRMGIKEVRNPEVYQGDIAFAIVPGLAFDRQGHRLGYGGGYYDHFLSGLSGAKTIGVCFRFQCLDGIPFDAHDVPVDLVVTSTGLFRPSPEALS